VNGKVLHHDLAQATSGSHRALGIYLGYPSCCIKGFGEILERTRLHPEDTGWSGTGYVPCDSCNEKIRETGFNSFVDTEITPNRIHPEPFPSFNDGTVVNADLFRVGYNLGKAEGVGDKPKKGNIEVTIISKQSEIPLHVLYENEGRR